MPTTVSEKRRVESGLEFPTEMGKFTSGMAHEIRNPLNAIRMQVAVIRNKLFRPSPENLRIAEDQLKSLDREVLRIEKLVKTFLEAARPQANNSENTRFVELVDGKS